MARTKADSAKKAGGKAPRKGPALRNSPYPSPKNSSKSSKSNTGGGNPYCPRPTPDWQKPISNFFPKETSNGEGDSQLAELEDLGGERKLINVDKMLDGPRVAPSASLGADPNPGSSPDANEGPSHENSEDVESDEDSPAKALEQNAVSASTSTYKKKAEKAVESETREVLELPGEKDEGLQDESSDDAEESGAIVDEDCDDEEKSVEIEAGASANETTEHVEANECSSAGLVE